jgi:hypothetical protein
MRMNYLLVTLLIAAILAISGCTSPSPTPSPSAIVSPTMAPTSVATLTPTPAVTAVPSAVPAITATVGNITASGISIDWDTTDILQHDVAHISLQNIGGTVIEDVNVAYTVVTPITIVDSYNAPTTSNQSKTASVYVGKMSPTEVKNVTIQSPDHMKNVTSAILINVSWKGGEGTVLQAGLTVPDGKLGTQTF